MMAWLSAAAFAQPGMFVLGVDGMDPVILQRLIDQGRVPNLAKMAREGAFQPLGTANPPQSPVAWSTFVTGVDPGGHGIFDFIHRDPATYHPIASATPAPEGEATVFRLFGYVLPISVPEAGNNRGGTPFWDLLHKAGVPVEVYRIPGNFPVPESEAKVLSGMGTPDLRGGYGTYTLFTDQPVPSTSKGDIIRVQVADYDLDGIPDTVDTALKGAPDVLHLEPGQVPRDDDYLTARVSFSVDPEHETVAVRTGDGVTVLREGEWSPWMTVSYDAAPFGLMPIEGIVRFYAKELRPGFQIYASPVNISPAAPAMPLTSPTDWATDLLDEIGPYYTQGMPEDTNALRDGTFTDDEYLKQVGLVQEDTRRVLDRALDGFKPGSFGFLYVSDIDLQCHMMWRHGDPKTPDAPPHPAMDPATAAAHAGNIDHFYEDVDELVGTVRAGLPADTRIIVMSDHGFQPFHTKFHLNAWLRDAGLLVLKDGATTGSLTDVDWSRTKAYGVGFNGLYLNIRGREGQGIVDPAAAGALEAEIRAGLEGVLAPETGARVVRRVVSRAQAYHGARVAEAPDLVVGYDAGFGNSDESTLGMVTRAVFEPNREKWSGNHLMDPEVVPGVLLVDRPIEGSGHDLTDLTATLLEHFGVAKPAEYVGQPITIR